MIAEFYQRNPELDPNPDPLNFCVIVEPPNEWPILREELTNHEVTVVDEDTKFHELTVGAAIIHIENRDQISFLERFGPVFERVA